MARRLAEAGVRVVQVFHGSWDHHSDIQKNMQSLAGECDQPIAALLADLQRQGMLDDTLVIWGGEFGRTPGYDKRRPRRAGKRPHSAASRCGWLAAA